MLLQIFYPVDYDLLSPWGPQLNLILQEIQVGLGTIRHEWPFAKQQQHIRAYETQ